MKFIRSSRWYRLVAGFILPPVLGVVPIWLVLVGESVGQLMSGPQQLENLGSILLAFPFLLMFAIIFVGIQSLIFSLLMEFVIRPRMFSGKRLLMAGACFGFLSALPLSMGWYLGLLFLPIGIAVGAVVSWLIR